MGKIIEKSMKIEKIKFPHRFLSFNYLRFSIVQLSNYLLLISGFLTASCANQVPPTGGAKDVKPPKVLKTSPENFSANFHAKNIIVSFDEYIRLKDLSTQLIVSPPLSKTPKVVLKKKS